MTGRLRFPAVNRAASLPPTRRSRVSEYLALQFHDPSSITPNYRHCSIQLSSFLIHLICAVFLPVSLLHILLTALHDARSTATQCSSFTQDYEGEPGDVRAGRDYFKKRFAKLAQKAGRNKEREIYIQCVAFLVESGMSC